ncbi:sugar phosphate nucleotidyltransferase [Acinetobacter baumannii]
MNLQPVILSGGSGTRLWPLSREKYPKQLLTLFNQHSMLQNTGLRLNNSNVFTYQVNSPIVVSNKEYRFLIAEQLKQIGIRAKILLEPCGRNTAPALTIAALDIIKEKKMQ